MRISKVTVNTIPEEKPAILKLSVISTRKQIPEVTAEFGFPLSQRDHTQKISPGQVTTLLNTRAITLLELIATKAAYIHIQETEATICLRKELSPIIDWWNHIGSLLPKDFKKMNYLTLVQQDPVGTTLLQHLITTKNPGIHLIPRHNLRKAVSGESTAVLAACSSDPRIRELAPKEGKTSISNRTVYWENLRGEADHKPWADMTPVAREKLVELSFGKRREDLIIRVLAENERDGNTLNLIGLLRANSHQSETLLSDVENLLLKYISPGQKDALNKNRAFKKTPEWLLETSGTNKTVWHKELWATNTLKRQTWGSDETEEALAAFASDPANSGKNAWATWCGFKEETRESMAMHFSHNPRPQGWEDARISQDICETIIREKRDGAVRYLKKGKADPTLMTGLISHPPKRKNCGKWDGMVAEHGFMLRHIREWTASRV